MKSLILILLIIPVLSCFQMGDYKSSFFNDNEKIVSEKDSYTYISRFVSEDDKNFETTFNSLSGVTTIFNSYLLEESKIRITLNKKIKSGEVKVVLIDPTNKVIDITTGDNQLCIKETGKYKIKILAFKATGSVKLFYEL